MQNPPINRNRSVRSLARQFESTKSFGRMASTKLFGLDDVPYRHETPHYLQKQERIIASNRTLSVNRMSRAESAYDSDDDSDPPYAELIDGIVFSFLNAAWFPIFVFATLWQSITTCLPVVPAKRHEITRTSWTVGGVIWLGMLFIGFGLAFLQRRTGAVGIVLIPIGVTQVATVIYVQMRPELSSRIPGHKKIHSTLCCISIYSSVDWSSFFNYWEPIVPIIEYFQIISVALSADMAEYWDFASERSFFSFLLVIDVTVLNVLFLLSITLLYFIGIGVFIHYQIDQKSNFGYVLYEFIPGAMFLTVSSTSLDAVRNGREVEKFAGYLTLALYSSTAIFVTIYRFHEKWFADIVYTPTWLALERILKQIFAIISVYAFGFPRLKLGLAIVVVIVLMATFMYLRPCSKPWLVYIRFIFMLSGLAFLFAGLVAVNHRPIDATIFLAFFQSVLFILLVISVGLRLYKYVNDPVDFVAQDAVYNLEIKAGMGPGRIKIERSSETFVPAPSMHNFKFTEHGKCSYLDNQDDLLDLIVTTGLAPRSRSGSDPRQSQIKSKKTRLAHRERSGSLPLPTVPPLPKTRRVPPPIPQKHRNPPPFPATPPLPGRRPPPARPPPRLNNHSTYPGLGDFDTERTEYEEIHLEMGKFDTSPLPRKQAPDPLQIPQRQGTFTNAMSYWKDKLASKRKGGVITGMQPSGVHE